jgi:preprotein translocase YajC subunit
MHFFRIALWICVLALPMFAQQTDGNSAAVAPQTSGTLDMPTISVSKETSSPLGTKGNKAPASFWEEFLTNPLWLMMAMLLVFYVGVVLPSQRSNRRQQREHAELISNLKKNDRVVTSFGVHGVVVSTQPEAGTVTIRLDENSNAKMTVNRDTIRVVKKD